MLARFLLILLLASASISHAKSNRTAELQWSVTGNSATSSLANGAARSTPLNMFSTATGPAIGGTKSLPWPGKSQALNMAAWKAAATPAAIAKSIMRPGSIIGLAASLGISELINEACVRIAGGELTLPADGAVWEECKFKTTNTVYWMVNSIPAPSGTAPAGQIPAAARSDRAAACAAWVDYEYTYAANRTTTYRASDGFCMMYSNGNYITGRGTQGVGTFPVTERDGWKPSTEAIAEAAVTAKGAQWTASEMAKAMDDPTSKTQRVLRELLDKGASVEVAPSPTVTGPATVVGSPVITKTTEQKPDAAPGVTREKTVTVQNTYNYIYNDNRVTQSTKTTTTTTYDDGTPAETKAEEKVDERSACEKDPAACEENKATDTALGERPVLYERKYPDGMGTVWGTRKTELLATPLGQLSVTLMPTIGTGGVCPSWMLDLGLGFSSWEYGSFDVAPPCYIWDFAKVVVVIGALLLARALVFGG